MVQHDSDLSQVKRKHETELQTLLRKIEDMNKSRDKEVSIQYLSANHAAIDSYIYSFH